MKNLNLASPSTVGAPQTISGWAKTQLRLMSRKPSSRRVNCNLCGARYRAANRFQRFCQTCRSENEVYRNAEWLPTAEFGV